MPDDKNQVTKDGKVFTVLDKNKTTGKDIVNLWISVLEKKALEEEAAAAKKK